MSENQNQQIAADTAAEHKKHRSHSGLWFGVVILLIILSLAGAGFLLLQQLREKQRDLGGEMDKDDVHLLELTKQISGYQNQLAALQSQMATLEAEVSGKEAFYDKKLSDFSQLHQEKIATVAGGLKNSITKVQRQLGKTRGDWLLADAEYLLSIANQRLHLMGDVNTTREALVAADHRLRESGDAAAFKVREQITKEIAAVGKVQIPDVVGIYAAIQLLEDNVDKLAIFLPYAGKEITPTEKHQHEKDDPDHVHDLLDSALVELEGLVTLRHTDQPVKAILTPEQAQFIRQQLRVKLEMVKISLVQHNEGLYQKSLADANKWLAENFAKNADADGFAKQIMQLSEIKISSQFPDISQSLKMLRDITKLRIETDKALQTEKAGKEQKAAPAKTEKPKQQQPTKQQQPGA